MVLALYGGAYCTQVSLYAMCVLRLNHEVLAPVVSFAFRWPQGPYTTQTGRLRQRLIVIINLGMGEIGHCVSQ